MSDSYCTESGRDLRRDIEVSDAQVNEVGKGIQSFKSTGAILDHADNAVEAFGGGVGQVRVSTKAVMPAACFRTVPTNLRKGSRRLRRAAFVHSLRKRSAAQRAL